MGTSSSWATSMTYGLYSKSQRVNLRKAIDKLDYGPEVIKAIDIKIQSEISGAL